MPIYAIKNNDTGQLRLVEAKRPISAVNHVVGTMFTVSEADARDGVELGRQGGTVEVAGQSAEDIEEERQRYHNSVAKLVGESVPFTMANEANDLQAAVQGMLDDTLVHEVEPYVPDAESDEAE